MIAERILKRAVTKKVAFCRTFLLDDNILVPIGTALLLSLIF